MAWAAAQSFSSTKGATNYARLCRLLVNVGSCVLRETFDRLHRQRALSEVLTSPPVMSVLQSLRGRRVLNQKQWEILFPANMPSVASKDFDITLLMVLLRNICNLVPPVTGWDSHPPATDISLEADIARIKYYRNTVYGHTNEASVDDEQYNMYWQEIKDTLVRLGGQRYETTIDHLATDCMDLESEKQYQDLLRQWVQDEENIKEKLDKIAGTLEQKIEDLREMVAARSEWEESMTDKIQQMENQWKNVSDKLDALVAPKEEMKDEENKTERSEEKENQMQRVIEKLDAFHYLIAENAADKAQVQQVENQVKNVSEKLDALMEKVDALMAHKDELNYKDKLQQMENHLERFDNLVTGLSLRAPLAHGSSHSGNRSMSSIQDDSITISKNEGNFGSTDINPFMNNAQMDSLGSTSSSSVFSGASIGTISNCPVRVENQFLGTVNFYNVVGQKDKVDTDKD